jgi:uncharacterized protein Usg
MHSEFQAKLAGASLLTAEILYYRPDHPSILQLFSWQTLDKGPDFPRLAQFLDHWRREIEAVIHSVTIAHSDWVGPSGFKGVDAEFILN